VRFSEEILLSRVVRVSRNATCQTALEIGVWQERVMARGHRQARGGLSEQQIDDGQFNPREQNARVHKIWKGFAKLKTPPI
jgi:hypothetical protein